MDWILCVNVNDYYAKTKEFTHLSQVTGLNRFIMDFLIILRAALVWGKSFGLLK